uniref:Uncharacterized protein n=1 Tax=Moniliophthora roreri TaxID=221103 RepID=A0A0W0G6J2_MONRR
MKACSDNPEDRVPRTITFKVPSIFRPEVSPLLASTQIHNMSFGLPNAEKILRSGQEKGYILPTTSSPSHIGPRSPSIVKFENAIKADSVAVNVLGKIFSENPVFKGNKIHNVDGLLNLLDPTRRHTSLIRLHDG